MPLLSLQLPDTVPPPLSSELAMQLTDITHRTLGKDPAVTAVAIERLKSVDWFVGGKSLDERKRLAASLRIHVTAGTNTKGQIADFIAGAHELLDDRLAPFEAVSYVIVEETPAHSWGFEGLTQEHRFVSGRLSAQR